MPRSTKANADRNRARLLLEAKRQFASKGFHGTSIANVAGELGLTKQTLLHHFGSKEQLFSEVLESLAVNLQVKMEKVLAQDQDPVLQLLDLVLGATHGEDETEADRMNTEIIIRELLENRTRAAAAQRWHLQSYLEGARELVRRIPGKESLTDAEAFAVFYQILGAASYFKISQPTLTGMFGKKELQQINRAFRQQVERYLRLLVDQA